MLLAIEGIDGAGKGTLCRELLARANAAGIRAAALSFPRYEQTQFSDLIGRYLRGEMGEIDQVPVRYAALLYGGDRFESRDQLLELIATHDLVILDRYVASNIAYNAAKVPVDERSELITWIEQLEYGQFDLPRPDLTLLLATSTALADQLVGQKAARSYTDDARDLHEANRDFLSIVADVYGSLAKAGGDRWLRVEPLDADGNLCPPADIAATVWQHPSLAALG
ncbi:MAG: thymidylate kinase [Rhodospirillaceae bacterium]|jgi:dTMP kinase|nr:thymidylate kinase [Rhodospirillaceae bacterium]MBT3492453.1 thymidylate kinase [Rhodospirillaceae bacterium]MBT3782931.1 thymidylate kinase [Rhodospirillaceae bacterium]MBT3977840.1 thymidylate kinase [Rhodospirillaceae bacterium]MBT4171461.1 thymidylate kinase [Rhodospirillaceae bacterium]